LAVFDARVFAIDDPVEVANYFVWRQQDAVRNAVAMAAQAEFSAKELHGVSVSQMRAKLADERGIDFDAYCEAQRRGFAVVSDRQVGDVVYTDKRSGEERVAEGVERRVWKVIGAPEFVRSEWLAELIPARD
jgi:tRNA(His) 5'-end guanylyltransferase